MGWVALSLGSSARPFRFAHGTSIDHTLYPETLQGSVASPSRLGRLDRFRLLQTSYFGSWLALMLLREGRRRGLRIVSQGWSADLAARFVAAVTRCGWTVILHDAVEGGPENRAVGDPAANGPRSWARRWLERRMRVADRVVVTTNEETVKLVRRGFDPDRIVVLPVRTVVPSGFGVLRSETARKALLERYHVPEGSFLVTFAGFLDWPPNRAAAEAILQRIAPETLRRDPRVHFLIVGAGAPLSVEFGPNVHLTGFVEDLPATISNCDLAIAPMRFSSGMLNKLMDAMAFGLPVLSTPAGKAGFESEGAPIVWRDLDAFPETICELLKNPEQRERLGRAGWSYVQALPPPDVGSLLPPVIRRGTA
jgi:glycosyltransferase involved in cell wall biosynthesis